MVRILIAALTVVGCAVVIKACTIPYAEFCDAAPACTARNHLPSLINDANYQVSPWVALVGLALAAAVAATAVLVLLRRYVERRIAAVALTATGVVTLVFFVSLVESYNPGRWGSVVGTFGGSLITLAGVVAAAGAFRARAGSR